MFLFCLQSRYYPCHFPLIPRQLGLKHCVLFCHTWNTCVFSLLFVKSQQDLKPELIITFDKAYAYPTKLITDDAFLQIKKVSYILVFCFIFLIFLRNESCDIFSLVTYLQAQGNVF